MDRPMKVTTREARARIAELLTAVEQGEAVEITRHGRVVAQMKAPETSTSRARRKAERTRLRESLPRGRKSATEIVRELREDR